MYIYIYIYIYICVCVCVCGTFKTYSIKKFIKFQLTLYDPYQISL